jgi:hypothetical protein
MARELQAVAQGCLEQFKALIQLSQETGRASQISEESDHVSMVEEQCARFKILAEDIGAFAEGHASLDYRLRDSPMEHQSMMNFLVDLKHSIHEGKCHFHRGYIT